MSQHRKVLLILVLALPLLVLPACGDSTDSGTPASAKSGAKSLTQAMTRASQAFDDLSSTRTSLDRFSQDMTGPIAQTGDVIGLLTGDSDVERKLQTAARQQRTFLQSAEEAASSRTYAAASRAANRARSAGRTATGSYARVVAEDDSLAGLVPPATAFNTSQLRRAVRDVFRKSSKKMTTTSKSKSNSSSSTSGGGSTSGVTDCGGGVSAGNSATSCPFARNVADVFRSSGGAGVIDVYSPVTGRTYTMTCVGSGPVTCSGGNGASVRIR